MEIGRRQAISVLVAELENQVNQLLSFHSFSAYIITCQGM